MHPEIRQRAIVIRLLHLGAYGQHLVFQTQACQMATLAGILGMLPEADNGLRLGYWNRLPLNGGTIAADDRKK